MLIAAAACRQTPSIPPIQVLHIPSFRVHRTPNASDALVRANDVSSADLLVLLSRALHQQLSLLEHTCGLEVADTDRLFPAIDVVGTQHGVLGGAGGDAEFDGWVL